MKRFDVWDGLILAGAVIAGGGLAWWTGHPGAGVMLAGVVTIAVGFIGVLR